MDIVKVILTSLLSVITLFLIAKIMGHKQLSQLDFFDYISGITIGSVAAELATELKQPLNPLIALVIYGIASVILNLITHKLPKMRKYVNGTPSILFEGGKLYRENMKKAKLDLSEFMVLCREAGYFDLNDIEVAIFEQNGKLSVLPKSEKRPLDPSDVGICPKAAHINTEIIMDGRIMHENLLRMGLDIKWLEKQLRDAGYRDAKEIFLCICDDERKLTMFTTK